MMAETNTEFTPQEAAYFETQGAADPAPPPLDAAVEEQQDAPATDAVDPVDPVEQQDGAKKQGMVPHGALHAEREERKKAEAKLAALEGSARETQAKLDAILARFNEAQKPEQGDDDPEPDMRQNIFEWSEWNKREQQRQLKAVTERQAAFDQQQQIGDQQRAINTKWETDAWEYSSKNPSFVKAAEFAHSMRDKQLTALAIVEPRYADPAFRRAAIDNELANIVAAAAQSRQNSAEIIYNFAVAAGFAPEAPQQEAPKGPTMDALERATIGSKSLSAATGKPGGDVTAETILAMPMPELKRWLKNPANEARYNRLLGG